ncbi:MAG: glycosyltransferase family 2 protein [Janthinobacterium lividum]
MENKPVAAAMSFPGLPRAPVDGPAGNTGSVAVVTINWNGWANTLECLASLRASRGPDWHLFIVDNASSDDSLTRLAGLGTDVTLIASPVNGGWTGGNNRGIEAALAAGFEWLFILNNDAFVEPDTIARLLAEARSQAERDIWPVLGPVHRGDSLTNYDFIGSTTDAKTGIPSWTDAAASASDRPHLTSTSYVSGAGMFVNRRHFATIGLLDDRFYLNFDDTDWCRRAAQAGFPLLMLTDATIRHIGSASIGGRQSPLQTYFMTRNRLLYAEKHCTWEQRLRLLRRYVWQARELTGRDDLAGWLPAVIRARSGATAAFRAGVADYLSRRFGDCPDIIRAWQAAVPRTPAETT